jgi:SAM-dependent methyltransferase
MTLEQLFEHTWTITALAIALERPDSDGAVERAARDVVRAAGLDDLLTGPNADVRSADLRSTLGTLLQIARTAHDPAVPLAGWNAEEPTQVIAQGIVSEAATQRMIAVLGQLPDLGARLEAGCAVLDVGAGAGGVGCAFASRYPKVRVVGVEISPVATEIGRKRIAEAGYGDRVEIRQQGGEMLMDRDIYDLAWVAQMFVPDAVLDGVFAAAARALAPGGYLVTAAACVPGETVPAAISRMRGAVWSGEVRFADNLIARLAAAGLPGARAMPGPGTMVPIVARRAS